MSALGISLAVHPVQPEGVATGGEVVWLVTHSGMQRTAYAMIANRPSLDVEFLRQQFPVFQHPDYGQWAYFENAGGSQAPRQVQDAMAHAFNLIKVQPYYPYGPSEELGHTLDEATTFLAEAMNAGGGYTITYGPSTTANTYMTAQGMRPHLKAGDEIVVSNQEHEANAGAWHRLADASGVTVREWQVDPETARLSIDGLRPLLSDKTKLLAFTHCSNVVGEIHDVAAIVALAQSAGARVVVDGVAYAPHRMPDVTALSADAYCFSAYKTFAAHQGVMAIKTDWLESLENQGHYFNGIYAEKRLNPVGPQHAEIASIVGLKEFYADLYTHHFGETPSGSASKWVNQVNDLLHAQEVEIAAPLVAFLADHPKLRLFGPEEMMFGKRAPTIAFAPKDGSDPRVLTKALADAKVGAAAGHFYAHRLMKAVGVTPDVGVARISLLAYNTKAEVTRAIEAIDAAL